MKELYMKFFGTNYHQGIQSDAVNNQADELMIANMISVLNNPHLLQMLDDEELKTILQTVKNHVVLKSKEALKWQDKYMDNNGRSR